MTAPANGFRKTARTLGVGALLALSACGLAPQPFDATAPWRPMQAREGYSFQSYGEGRHATAGSGPVAEFTGTQPEVDPRGENPWARPGVARGSICYSSLINSEAEVMAEAVRICPAPGRVEFQERSTIANSCPLLQPTQVTFRCLDPGDPGAAEDDGPPGERREGSLR